MKPEVCVQCAFDGLDYTVEDAAGTLRSFGRRWQWLAEGLPDPILGTRPEPGVWSVIEYTAHSRDILGVLGLALQHMVDHDRPDFGAEPPSAPPDAGGGFEHVVDGLAANADRLQRAAVHYPPDVWAREAIFAGEVIDAGWVLRHACHDATHHLGDAGRIVHRLGAGAATRTGVVAAVHTSDGGVPKLAVDHAGIGRRGLSGDRQGNRHHHGRVSQAVCLWSTEVIEALAAEGHPIAPGRAGDNVTVSGLDWSAMRPGVRLAVGTALLEVTGYADPCHHNAQWFLNGDFGAMDQDRFPGRSRIYAAVLGDGEVRVGDAVIVEPGHPSK